MGTTVIYSANLAASTKTANILSGDVNEFITQDSVVSIYQVSSATAIRTTVYADSDIVVDDKEIPFIGTSLVSTDQMMASFVVYAGTRLSITLRETAAVATTDVYTKIQVDAI